MSMKTMELPGMSETSSVKTEFLGWGDGLIARAADWLVQTYGDELGSVLVAVPGARAGRVLSEELARRASPSAATPRILTPGSMTDEVLELEGVIAGRLARTMVWEHAMRALDPKVRKRIISRDPSVFGAWVRLSENLRTLHGELATEGLDFSDVLDFDFGLENTGERSRWEALALAQEGYRSALADLGLADPHDARWAALKTGKINQEVQLVLVGVADPNQLVRAVVNSLGGRVTALVFAPEELSEGFDEVGGVLTSFWKERELPISLSQWHVADKPADQAERAMELISHLGGHHTAEELTIGVCSDEIAPYLDRCLAAEDVRARHGSGKPVAETSVVRLLDAAARFLERPRFSILADLLRHPDLESCVAARCELGEMDAAICLDSYYNEHLPDVVDGTWIEGGAGSVEQGTAALHDSLMEILGEIGEDTPRKLSEWTGPIRALLERVYAGVMLHPEQESERILISALSCVSDALAEIDALGAKLGERKVRAHEALELISWRVSTASVPPAPAKLGEPTIELLGWLELLLDDSSALIITGWNEGSVPESIQGHPFLPEILRQALKIATNDDRQARDAYSASALAQKSQVSFISGRRSTEGEPKLPSRLAFHCSEDECIERTKFWLLDHGGGRAKPSSEAIPEPELPRSATEPAVESMRVTDFKTYLESPYLFYLQRVIKKSTVDDTARELDPLQFGNIIHDALEKFGESEIASSNDPKVIEDFLVQSLERRILRQFGSNPLSAVAIQVEQIKYRYQSFARWQAQRVREGWEIVHTEWAPEGGSYHFDVDGQPMPLRGRIDRIDRNADGRWAVLDYKTGDKPPKLSDAYGSMKGWKDLQLPLYQLLSSELEMEQPPQLGYVAIARDVSQIGTVMGSWKEEVIDEAYEVAKEVIREVRAGEFFERGRVPRYDLITQALFGQGLLTGSSEEEEEEG
jgi:ATP-dependent helicase/nuclease subunit B